MVCDGDRQYEPSFFCCLLLVGAHSIELVNKRQPWERNLLESAPRGLDNFWAVEVRRIELEIIGTQVTVIFNELADNNSLMFLPKLSHKVHSNINRVLKKNNNLADAN